MRKLSLVMAAASLAFISCKEVESPDNSAGKYGAGVFITNEGAFQSGAGTVSFYNPKTKEVQNDVFLAENGFALGNVLQSVTVNGSNAYFVINNTGVVEIANANTMKSKGMIAGFNSPRYFQIIDNSTAYVSDWFDNNIKVVNLNSNTIVDSIKTGEGPEQMAVSENKKVFVANTGGFNTDSTITVINGLTNQVEKTIYVGYLPQSLQIDKNGILWVLCSGKANWTDPNLGIPGELIKINTNTLAVVETFKFTSNALHPVHLKINGSKDVLYFISDSYGGELFRMNITDAGLPSTAIVNKSFYGLGVDPVTEEVYGSDAVDFNQSGWVYRYTKTGEIVDSISVGVIPGNFGFK